MEYFTRISFQSGALEASLDQVFRTLAPERALIAFQSNLDEPLELAVQRGFVGQIRLSEADVSHSTLSWVFEKGTAKSATDCMELTSHGPTESMTLAGLRSVLCAPIVDNGGKTIGVIYADDKQRVGTFAQEHADWLCQVGKALGSRLIVSSQASTTTAPLADESEETSIWRKFRERGLNARKIGNLVTADKNLAKALAFCRYRQITGMPLAKTLNDLAEVRRIQGNLRDAELLIRECIETVESSQEFDCRSTVSFYNNLAGLLFARGQMAESESVYCRILERLEAAGGLNRTSAIPVLCNLGTLCLQTGELKRALLYNERAARLALEMWGTDDPVTQRCLEKLEQCRSLSA